MRPQRGAHSPGLHLLGPDPGPFISSLPPECRAGRAPAWVGSEPRREAEPGESIQGRVCCHRCSQRQLAARGTHVPLRTDAAGRAREPDLVDFAYFLVQVSSTSVMLPWNGFQSVPFLEKLGHSERHLQAARFSPSRDGEKLVVPS